MSVQLMVGGMDGALPRFARVGVECAATLEALDNGIALEQGHTAFLDAGADVIRTQTAALGRWQMNMAGLGDRFAQANQTACHAAVTARDKANGTALVAGAIGPVRARYEPDLLPPFDLIEAEVVEQALVLAPHVDLFICEAMSLGAEAAATVRAALSTGRPVWVAFTLHHKAPLSTRGGETLPQALGALAGLDVRAVLVNCTAPEVVREAIAVLASHTGPLPIGGYAHLSPPGPAGGGSGNPCPSALPPEAYAQLARLWIKEGAAIVGGCCGVSPAHIAHLKMLVLDGR